LFWPKASVNIIPIWDVEAEYANIAAVPRQASLLDSLSAIDHPRRGRPPGQFLFFKLETLRINGGGTAAYGDICGGAASVTITSLFKAQIILSNIL
jgi:hypothetical protein